MRNILLTIEYDGTNYHGWQRQKNAVSVQQLIEESIQRVTGDRVKLIGSGRTDTGVHALGQRANFKSQTQIPAERIPQAINSCLPDDIRIIQAIDVKQDFHARYDAVAKKYRYRIYNNPVPSAIYRNHSCFVPEKLNVDMMIQACEYMTGEKDFSSFCSSGSVVRSKIRNVKLLELTRQGKMIDIIIQADGFLYKMVRSIAGTLVEVGKGNIPPCHIEAILDKKDRRYAGPTLPPQGLFLEEVLYGSNS
jgi:tRNA pseudouridine38-40 synthase